MPVSPRKECSSSTADPIAAPSAETICDVHKRDEDDDDDMEMAEILFEITPRSHQERLRTFLYGRMPEVRNIKGITTDCPKKDMQVKSYGFWARSEQLRDVRLTRVALFQHQLPLPTNKSVKDQRDALLKMASEAVSVAVSGGCDIFCFPELWNMPYVFCTPSKNAWVEYAESATRGLTITYLCDLAKHYKIIIISPIMERDDNSGVMYSTAVIIDQQGCILGKHRKHHIPKIEGCNESNFFSEGDYGHAVYETEFGNIAVNICDGRHHPLNWLLFGLNGAEIVFNPCACSSVSDDRGAVHSMWPIEARNAAFQNSYYVCALNRVGKEVFKDPVTNTMHEKTFFGSTYVAAPDGSRCPSLSSKRKGLLLVEMDINLCRQSKDNWGFQAVRKLPLYSYWINAAATSNYLPQIVHRPAPPGNPADIPVNGPVNPANPANYPAGPTNNGAHPVSYDLNSAKTYVIPF